MNSLRILVADDHDLVRRGIKSFLEAHDGWTVCAEAQTGRGAVEQARELNPDIAILDITMPELNGIDAARRIQKESPKIKTIIVSMHYSENIVREILAAGINGYVVKSDSVRDLGVAIEAVANGKTFFTTLLAPETLADLRARSHASPNAEPIDDRLTSREREILQLLSEGKSSKEVAALLALSVKTVDTHRSNMMRKLEVHNAVDLVRYAVRNRIIEP